MKIAIPKGANLIKSILFILFMCYTQVVGVLRLIADIDLWESAINILIILALLYLLSKCTKVELIICIVYIAALTILLFAFPRTPGLTGENGVTVALQFNQGFIGFFIAFLCANASNISKDLKIVGLIFFVYIFWFVSTGRVFDESIYNSAGYNMAFGFNAMAACMITLFFSFTETNKRMKIIWIIMSVILTIFITMLGSRGPLLGIVCIFVLTYLTIFLRDNTKSTYIKVISIITLVVLVLLILLIPNVFFDIISSLSSVLGFDASQSRTLERLINGSALKSSGRYEIWSWFVNHLNLLGHGAFSEWYYYGSYAHNFFLDILFDFGVVFGALIIVGLFYQVAKTIKIGYQFDSYALFIVTFAYFIGRLMLSSTFWWETYFWMLLGVMARVIMQNNSKMNKEECIGFNDTLIGN